jgi:hypothetical protein
VPEWRNWQTHQTQNLASRKGRVGSTPTSGTIITTMGANVIADGKKLSLNPFMESLIENVVRAVARSLKAPQTGAIEFVLHGDSLNLTVNGQPVPLDLGHAQHIVGNILRGIVQSLHGAEHGHEFRFLCE